MTHDEFQAVVDARLAKIAAQLLSKGKEYAAKHRTTDRLANFKHGAELERSTPMKACLGRMSKQLVSIVDYIHDDADGIAHTEVEWQEKLGDAINYLILLEGLVKESLCSSSAEKSANGSASETESRLKSSGSAVA
jgi:hypothetical protein